MKATSKSSKGAARGKSKPKLTIEQRRRIYCVKHGHSRLREHCFGYHHCCRCGDLLGDSLGGSYSDDSAIYVTHMHAFTHQPEEFSEYRNCNCPDNAKKLTAKDLAMVPQWDSSGREQRPPWRQRTARPERKTGPQENP